MTVRHRTGAYVVRFVAVDEVLRDLPESSFVITDRNVFSLYGHVAPGGVPVLQLDPGERSKSTSGYLQAIHWLAESGAQRNATVVAFGGGVVGDLAGFAAATYMRGIAYIQAPASLLAQVDSSVGGKCGVDLPQGKNMLGAFHPPVEVRVSTGLLGTLPPRQFANGMAEVLKYGFIMAPDVLAMNPEQDIAALVRRCIDCKREVVEADEFELTGRRAILNFGHTVGHALELATGYRDLLHGEAISVGMAVEARLSERLGMAPAGTQDAVSGRLMVAGLPVSHPLLSNPSALLDAMRRDKKTSSGKLAFSLLRDIGSCELVTDVPEADVRAALAR